MTVRSYWEEAIEPRFFLVRQLLSAGGTVVGVLAGLNVVIGALPVVFVVATSTLIGRVPDAATGGLGSPQWDALVSAFLSASAVFFAQQLLTPLHQALGQRLKHRIDGHYRHRVMAAATRGTGIGPLEDPVSLASLYQATEGLENGFRTPGDAAAGMLALVVRYTRLIGFGVLVAAVVSWWAGALVCAGTMLFRYGHRGGLRIYSRLWPKVAMHRRRRDYFLDLGLSARSGKEVRVFGLTDWIIDQYRVSGLASLRPVWAARRRANVVRFLWFTAAGLAICCAVLAIMVRSAASGQLTLTELTLGLQATIGAVLLGEFYHEADPATQFGMLSARALTDFEHQRATRHPEPVATPTRTAAGRPTSDIRFADVSFTYPGSDRPVLDGLDLTLRAGECTALVGLNGAGKTTLVKLLARLYEPTRGALLIDGIDAREFPVDEWRRQIGVIFQDFNRYELSVTDNIAFGAVHHADPDTGTAVRRAAREAGAAEIIDGLPAGYHTVLAPYHEGGVDLSGGQWQRIALARTRHAVNAGARVLVLDEPTAALDVRAEAAFFAEFIERMRGRTVLLVSHRFASVRRADRIVVLAEGRVVEDGTHESLLARGGRYAHLFDLQARRFAADSDTADGGSGRRAPTSTTSMGATG